MEVKIDVSGVPVTISCDTAEELQQVLNTVKIGGFATGADSTPAHNDPVESEKLHRLLSHLQGHKSALVLLVLSEHLPCSDTRLRRELPDDLVLASAFAHLSKTCKKLGIDYGDVITKESHRGRDKKMRYQYTLSDQMALAVKGFDDFDKEPEIPPGFNWE